MPTNKNASYRYRIIDICLKNTGRKWTLEDLMDEIAARMEEDFGKYSGISKRTVQSDLNIMRSSRPRGFDAPIVCKDGLYSYEDAAYSIENNPLNDKDIRNIDDAIDILKQFKDIPVLSELQEMVIRLEGIAPYRQKAKRKWIDFEMNENLKGLSFIIPIYNAIKNEIVLTIDYRPYNRSENLSMTIHPYLLKEYHNRWFLIGYNSELEKISHLALDRIEGIAFSEQSFLLNMKYRESDYFENVLGITIPEKAEPEIIELKLTPERAPYIKTKPIHSSQTIVEDDESGMVIRLRLIINKELISELLSYCKDLKVISPKHLAQMIKDDLRKAQESYTE